MVNIKGVRIAQEGIREFVNPNGWGLVSGGGDGLLPNEGGYYFHIDYVNESGEDRTLTATFSKSAIEEMLSRVREY